jgi:hypothetical protein
MESVADHPLSLNCNVYIEQKSMKPLWDSYQRAQEAYLRVFRTYPSSSAHDTEKDLLVTPADFGCWRPKTVEYSQNSGPSIHETSLEDHLDQPIPQQWQQPMMAPDSAAIAEAVAKRIKTKRLVRLKDNEMGCRPYTNAQADRIRDKMVVVDRGGCLFILKAYYAQAAGAHSVVVVNTEDKTFAMTGPSSKESPPASGGSVIGESIHDDDIDIHAVMISRSGGKLLLDWIREDEKFTLSFSSSETTESEDIGLTAGIVQRKLTKEEMASARLSYNSLPIVNVFSVSVPATAVG